MSFFKATGNENIRPRETPWIDFPLLTFAAFVEPDGLKWFKRGGFSGKCKVFDKEVKLI